MAYRVDSYHINIGVGDAAIHVLAKPNINNPAILPECVKVVWIDAGKSGGSSKVITTLENIEPLYKTRTGGFKIDVVIVTHWDSDHYGGFNSFMEQTTKVVKYFRYGTNNTPRTKFLTSATMIDKCPAFVKGARANNGTLKIDNTVVADVYYGTSLLGADIFSDTDLKKISPGHPTPGSVNDIHDLITNMAGGGRPAMFCIAIEGELIGPSSQTRVLSGTMWVDKVTLTNESSLAAVIAWPNGRVSHYFAGDLNAAAECALVEWLRPAWENRRIPSMKCSHHGACSSTPTTMIDNFRPYNIIISAGSMHNHPGDLASPTSA